MGGKLSAVILWTSPNEWCSRFSDCLYVPLCVYVCVLVCVHAYVFPYTTLSTMQGV